MTVLIVDDEHVVREGISYTIRKEFKKEISNIYTAKTGREAIQVFEEQYPDIVLLDIHMPGINGIQALRTMRKSGRDAVFIIISAFEHFDYAKEAIELGAKEYISKPIEHDVLIQVLKKSVQDIRTKREVKEEHIMCQEKIQEMLPKLEFGLVYGILLNPYANKSNIQYWRLLDYKYEYGSIMIMEFSWDAEDVMEHLIDEKTYVKLRSLIKYKYNVVVGPLMENKIVIVIEGNKDVKEYYRRLQAMDVAYNIKKIIEGFICDTVKLGIGTLQPIKDLHTSYLEAEKALSIMGEETLLHIEDATNMSHDSEMLLPAKVKNQQFRITGLIEQGRDKACEKSLRRFFTQLDEEYLGEEQVKVNIGIELLVLLNMIAFRNSLKDEQINVLDYMTMQWMQLKSYITAKAISLANCIRCEKDYKASQIIKDAIAFINQNYHRDIRLKQVAENICISPQYFSRVFKNEMGKSFIEYLTELRMDKAKELITSHEYSIKEVCFMIGYKDPNYFSRLFKKQIGVSPTEF